MNIIEAVSLLKGPIDKLIKLVLLRVNESSKKEKINLRLVRDTFKVTNKDLILRWFKETIRVFLSRKFKKDFSRK